MYLSTPPWEQQVTPSNDDNPTHPNGVFASAITNVDHPYLYHQVLLYLYDITNLYIMISYDQHNLSLPVINDSSWAEHLHSQNDQSHRRYGDLIQNRSMTMTSNNPSINISVATKYLDPGERGAQVIIDNVSNVCDSHWIELDQKRHRAVIIGLSF